jgi:hypothetical protein
MNRRSAIGHSKRKRNVMGQQERGQEERKASKRERAKQQRGRRASATGITDLRGINWEATAALIIAFAETGGAIRIGLTRDGGAIAIGCYLGDDYATEYVRPSEDYVEACAEIAEAWLPENGISYHQCLNEFERKTPQF